MRLYNALLCSSLDPVCNLENFIQRSHWNDACESTCCSCECCRAWGSLGFSLPPKSPDCGTSKLASLLHCPGQWLWRVPYTGDGCCAFSSKWQGSPCKTVCSVALVISFQNWCFKTINVAVNMYFYLLCMLKAPVTRRFLFYYCCWAKLLRTGTWAHLSCCCLLLSVSFQKQTFISHCFLWKYFFSLLQSFSFHIFLQEL